MALYIILLAVNVYNSLLIFSIELISELYEVVFLLCELLILLGSNHATEK